LKKSIHDGGNQRTGKVTTKKGENIVGALYTRGVLCSKKRERDGRPKVTTKREFRYERKSIGRTSS